jgi:hypothetical protein
MVESRFVNGGLISWNAPDSSRFWSLKYHVGFEAKRLSQAHIPNPVPTMALLESNGSIERLARKCGVTVEVYGA